MTANSIFLTAAAIFILGAFALVLAAIKYGFKWAKVADISLLKAFGFHILFSLSGAAVGVALVLAIFCVGIQPSETVLNIFAYTAQFLIPAFIVLAWYKVGFWRAALALVPYFASSFAVLGFALLIVRPLLYECFSIPTNSMAPTLLGEHVEAPCPRCGELAYTTPPDQFSHAFPEGLQMVCSQERQTVYVKDVPKEFVQGDRITACKLIAPKRWDLIVFRLPSDPSINYVKRLVGLPGEKLEIKDGAIWINGERMEPPESIRGITYSPAVHSYGRENSGPGSAPVELRSDEYFVLGDFVDAASDSRLWERGAPGHPPYAVPASHIVGVVINTYWPPDRWTSFR